MARKKKADDLSDNLIEAAERFRRRGQAPVRIEIGEATGTVVFGDAAIIDTSPGRGTGGWMEMPTATKEQLSFDVGGDTSKDLVGTIGVSGKLYVSRDVERDAEVIVSIATPDGEVIATGTASITAVAFVNKADKDHEWVERQHKASL